MDNWRIKSPAPDRPGTSSASMSKPHKSYFQRCQTPSGQIYDKTYFGLYRGSKGAFSKLIDLIASLSDKDSSETIHQLIGELDDFAKFLESNLESDWIVMTIAMLSKVCSVFFRQTKLEILKVAANAQFLRTLEKFLRDLKDEVEQKQDGNKRFWKNPEEFLVNLLFVCESIMDIIAAENVDILQKLLEVIDSMVPYLSQKRKIEVSRKTKTSIKILIENLGLGKIRSQSVTNSAINKMRRLSANFRSEEISEFTRTDIAKGRDIIDNVEAYLEVQSTLMLKGFVASLQEEIDKCIERTKSSVDPFKSSSIPSYPDAVIRTMVFADHQASGAILNFSKQGSIEEIFSKSSKRFNSGSTMFITKDNFSSVLVGWVIKKDLIQKHLMISFENDTSCILNGVYTIAESNFNFFVCYTALKGFQCITEADFPMKRYLIDDDPIVERPNYLDASSCVYTIQGSRVDLFGNKWPTADQLKMDTTQLSAFQAALTQKFVMIQGVPGTGKTFLGLQIVKTLLHEDNQRIWYNENPILIVSLSKQVLDKFLESLISTTRRIIRVGNTESKRLINFTLKKVRARNGANLDLKNIRTGKMKILISKFNKCNNRLNEIMDFNNNILHFEFFESIDDNLKTGWFSHASAKEHIAWLFDEQNTELHSVKISEVIKQITEEKDNVASLNGNTALNGNDLPGPNRLLFSKRRTWSEILKISNKVQEADLRTDEIEKSELETQLNKLWRNYQYFKMKMIDREFSPAPIKPIDVNYRSPHTMDSNDRWNLYFYWLNLYKQFVEKEFREIQSEHRKQCELLSEIQDIQDLKIIKQPLILGMTNNAAGRMRTTLQTLKCRIVVVLEASRVSEFFTVLSLTDHCEHLILMGDQQQINLTPPGTSNKYLSVGASIIERMLNKVPCQSLGFQHRMRPEISQLFVPFYYSEMKNHHSVTNLPRILGIPSCIFFVNHQHDQDSEEYNSKTNLYEAKFLINLARYLRQVGYAPEDITILSVYSGQVNVLYKEREKYQDLLQGIEIRPVDTYQAEECKIILLSLVRNNQEGKIGCLKSESFVNLALSRAREALYMMGNIDLLCQNNEIWPKIKKVLVEKNLIENYLPVCCKNNPNHVTKIEQPEDFDQVPEEVCSKICGHLLNCGHSCCKNCHSVDADHTSLSCTELCKK